MKYNIDRIHFFRILKSTLLFLAILQINVIGAQSSKLDKEITITFKNDNLETVLSKIEKATGYSFSYAPDAVKNDIVINRTYNNTSLQEILNDVLVEYQIYYRVMGKTIMIRTEARKGWIKGKTYSKKGEVLPFVSVALKGTTFGASSDENGNFSIYAPAGAYTLVASSIGFETLKKNVTVIEDDTINVDFRLNVSSESLDEVVISAGRTPEKLSEIPASITVINSKKLQKLSTGTTNISDILEYAVPGMAPSTGTFSSWGQTLRGRNLSVLVDGIPQSTPLRNGLVDIKSVSPNNISRVEVIKGAAAIYGNGGDGGVINYITKEPIKNIPFEGNTDIWTTSNLSKTKGAMGWGIYQSFSGKKDKVSYYVSGSFEETGNKYDANSDALSPTYGLDNTQIFSALGKIEYLLNEQHSLSGSLSHYQSRQNSPFVPLRGSLKVFNAEGDHLITPTIGVAPTTENPIPEEVEGMGVTSTNVQLKYRIKEMFSGTTDFTTDLYYQTGKNIFFYDATYFEGGGQTVVNTDKFGVRPIFTTKIAIEKPLQMSFTYGLDLLKDKTNQELLDGRIWTPNIDLLSVAPFLQAKLTCKENWVIKTGLRYDNMRAKINDFFTLPVSPKRDGNYSDPIAITGGDINFSNTSANFGLRYIKHNEFIPYVNFSQGFSLPDVGRTVRGGSSTDVSTINPKAIKTNNYEFGFLSKLKYLRFEAVGFYSTSNLGLGLIRVEDTDIFVQSENPQKIFGAEVSADFTFLNNNLQFGGSYSYVEGLKHTPDDKTVLTYIGGDVIAPPKITAYINVKPTNKLSASLRMVRVGDRERFNTIERKDAFTYRYREVPVTGYTLLNFSSSYDINQKLSVYVGINNLLNTFYLPARSQWASSLGTYHSAGEGINGKLGVKYNF